MDSFVKTINQAMNKGVLITTEIEQLYQNVKDIIETSRAIAYRAANTSMVQTYWNIGRLIVEEEQKGEQRAEYGKTLLKELSKRLQIQYGKDIQKPI